MAMSTTNAHESEVMLEDIAKRTTEWLLHAAQAASRKCDAVVIALCVV